MSGNVKFNGWINDDGSENYKCRAWVNFNGTGTVAIRASGNVSSITDNGVGDYTVNFSVAMSDANYAVSGVVHTPGVASAALQAPGVSAANQTTGSLKVRAVSMADTLFDAPFVSVVIFR